MTFDKSMVVYAVAAIAIIGVLFFVVANLGGSQRLKGVEKTEDVDEAKLDAALGQTVDSSPLSQPQKE
ncbi:MAG: hypothetical protein JO092_01940 [Candidatus Eremiobacteraeota bacterium]|nr:hypothetical protein [Candidatus Eremiobacteraeota bacterium]